MNMKRGSMPDIHSTRRNGGQLSIDTSPPKITRNGGSTPLGTYNNKTDNVKNVNAACVLPDIMHTSKSNANHKHDTNLLPKVQIKSNLSSLAHASQLKEPYKDPRMRMPTRPKTDFFKLY